MKKTSKKRKLTRDEMPIVTYFTDGKPFVFDVPPVCKAIRREMRKYNRENGTRLSAAAFFVKEITDMWNHPVKRFIFGSPEEQDRLAPSDLLPRPIEFANRA